MCHIHLVHTALRILASAPPFARINRYANDTSFPSGPTCAIPQLYHSQARISYLERNYLLQAYDHASSHLVGPSGARCSGPRSAPGLGMRDRHPFFRVAVPTTHSCECLPSFTQSISTLPFLRLQLWPSEGRGIADQWLFEAASRVWKILVFLLPVQLGA